MENTLENKARLFAQYWGQFIAWNIKWNHNIGNGLTLDAIFFSRLENIEEWALNLKSLSDITDEDAIELGYDNAEDFIKNELRWDELRKIGVQDADYLRSKAYALPFNNLSVEQQLGYGWIIIKKLN